MFLKKSSFRVEVDAFAKKDDKNNLMIPVSALKKIGTEDLRFLLERKVFDVTGRKVFSLKVNPQGSYLRYFCIFLALRVKIKHHKAYLDESFLHCNPTIYVLTLQLMHSMLLLTVGFTSMLQY